MFQLLYIPLHVCLASSGEYQVLVPFSSLSFALPLILLEALVFCFDSQAQSLQVIQG